MDEKKTTKGRQKIAIEKIEKENDCYATFSKRRQGLFKKASELSTLCDADVGVFVFSPTGKPFSFFHPSMEAVVSRFRSGGDGDGDDASRLVEAFSRTRVSQLNRMIDKIGGKVDEEVEREKRLGEMVKGERWWEIPVEKLEKEQVEELMALLRNLQLELRRNVRSDVV